MIGLQAVADPKMRAFEIGSGVTTRCRLGYVGTMALVLPIGAVIEDDNASHIEYKVRGD